MRIETLPVTEGYLEWAPRATSPRKKTATEGGNLDMYRDSSVPPGIMSVPTRETKKLHNPDGTFDGLERWGLSQ